MERQRVQESTPSAPGSRLAALVRAESDALARELATNGAARRPLAIVLGSGLASVAERLVRCRRIPASELQHLPQARVQGHEGGLALGDLGGIPTIVQIGRVHLYEGRSPFEVTRSVRAFAALDVRTIVLTNAAGGLVPNWKPGTCMRITDHLDLQRRSPILAAERRWTSPYDETLGTALDASAAACRVTLERGVYAGMPGPSYETPAEIRALQALGAHAVGMSTVCEASAAFAGGLRVVALSCIANPAAGLGREPLSHADVLSVMRRAANALGLVLERAAPLLVS